MPSCTICKTAAGQQKVFSEPWMLQQHLRDAHGKGTGKLSKKHNFKYGKGNKAPVSSALTKFSGKKQGSEVIVRIKEVVTIKNGKRTVSREEERRETVTKPVVHKEKIEMAMTGSLVLSIDVSGSTAGRGHREILEGIDMVMDCVNERRQPKDVLGVYTFNNDVQLVLPFGKAAKVNVEELKAKIIPRGRTALMDGIGEPLEKMQAHCNAMVAKFKTNEQQKPAHKRKKLVPRFHELMVLTDGAENASSNYTESTVRHLLQHTTIPNLHVTLIHVADSSDTTQNEKAIQSLYAVAQGVGQDRVSVVALAAAQGNIKKAFQQFITTFKKRVSFEKQVTVTSEKFTQKYNSNHKGKKLLTNGRKTSPSQVCNICKKPGHLPKNCFFRTSPSQVCNICKKPGHLPKNCFFRSGGGDGGGCKTKTSHPGRKNAPHNKHKNSKNPAHCAHCGQKRVPRSNFCEFCGAKH